MNLYSQKPVSIDHYLAKDLVKKITDSPEYMTNLGVFDNFGFIFRHNERLSVQTSDKRSEDYKHNLNRLKILQSFDKSKLSKSQKITQKIAIFDTQNDIEAYERFKYHSYPFNQISGNHLNLVEFMTDTHPMKTLKDARNYIDRVEMFDEVLIENLSWLKAQKEQEIFLPKFVMDHVIGQLEELISYEDSNNPLMQIFIKKIDNIGINEGERTKLINELSEAIKVNVKPGYQSILSFMIENYKYANPYHGVWSLPDGDDFYALRLRTYTTTDYSAAEIHEIGLQEVERIGNRMKEIFIELGYEVNKPIGEMMSDLNENPEFLYEDTPDRKEIVIKDYNQMVKEAEQDVKPYFFNFPESPVEVRAVPEYSEKTAAGGYYQSPSLDGSRPGVFYANLYDIKQTPKFGMRTLTFHEAVPGHHFQIALNLENDELTLYRRLGYRTSAYTEGWALYAEQLGVEVGMTKSLYDELGVLQSEMFRANRLVVDTGLHYKKWTREKAMKYMKKVTGMSDTEVRVEIERYIVWPGQATSYKMGMIKILDLRDKAMKELGAKFDLRKFHSIVLDQGIVPLFILDDLIDEWINEEKTVN
ncbi:DUF885 domain-containing protein [SAR86 cluster bacterium]|nr:DUF885 domain-containing protein [SAR86 cluster bacterium]